MIARDQPSAAVADEPTLRALRRLLPRRRLQALLGTGAKPLDLVRFLRQAGELTPYQAEQIQAGRGQRLRLGPYLLLEPIGSGGMGQVFRARHRVMKRLVAVKVVGVARGDAEDTQALARFRREAEAAARLAHPHVVTTYDACSERGALFLVMELLPGTDLHRRVRDGGPLPWPLACAVVRQAALGLQAIHEAGLLHRDVKPSNVMLLDEHQPHVKLLDLGLARLPGRRRSQRLQGSVDFLAPERGVDPDGDDPRSDLYGLGCTLYFLLTGEIPFPGDTWTEKLLRHRLDPVPDVRTLRPDVPADLADLLARLLAKESDDRPASAAAVASDLEGLCARERSRSLTVAAAVPEPPVLAARRWPGLWALTAALGAGLLLVWVGQALVSRHRAPPGVPTPVEPAQARTPEAVGVFRVGDAPFATLEEAVRAAHSGGVVSIDADGPLATPALDCGGQAVTLRAAPGRRPCLVLTPRPGALPWQGLLRSAAPLTVEAVDLAAEPDPAGGPLLEGTDTVVRLTGCRLRAPGRPVAVAVRRGSELQLTDTHLEGGAVAVSVEVGPNPCRVTLAGSTLRADDKGIALSVWSAPLTESAAAQIELDRGSFDAGVAVALHGLPGGATVTARGSTFRFRQAVVDVSGRRDAWRDGLRWTGSANRYAGNGPWLRVDGAPGDVTGLVAWRALWAGDEGGSVAGRDE